MKLNHTLSGLQGRDDEQVIIDSITPFWNDQALQNWGPTQLEQWEDKLTIAYANFVSAGQSLRMFEFTAAGTATSHQTISAIDLPNTGGDDTPTLFLTNTENVGIAVPASVVAQLYATAKGTWASRYIVRGRVILATGAVLTFVLSPWAGTF